MGRQCTVSVSKVVQLGSFRPVLPCLYVVGEAELRAPWFCLIRGVIFHVRSLRTCAHVMLACCRDFSENCMSWSSCAACSSFTLQLILNQLICVMAIGQCWFATG
jgi:hypothetical protein